MAHRLVFDNDSRNVTIYERLTSQNGHPWQWVGLSYTNVVLRKGVRQRAYSIREWLSSTECRATLTEVREIQ